MWDKHKTVNEVTDLDGNISIITLTINGKNYPVKIQRLLDWI